MIIFEIIGSLIFGPVVPEISPTDASTQSGDKGKYVSHAQTYESAGATPRPPIRKFKD